MSPKREAFDAVRDRLSKHYLKPSRRARLSARLRQARARFATAEGTMATLA